MARLDQKTSVPVEVLDELITRRVQEAEALLESGHSAGAIYLAGYAVECALKERICRLLDVDQLPVTFHSHDLEALLLHAGLTRKLSRNKPVRRRFRDVCGMWMGDDPKDTIRYRDPRVFQIEDAKNFLAWVNDPTTGIVPWVRKHSL